MTNLSVTSPQIARKYGPMIGLFVGVGMLVLLIIGLSGVPAGFVGFTLIASILLISACVAMWVRAWRVLGKIEERLERE